MCLGMKLWDGLDPERLDIFRISRGLFPFNGFATSRLSGVFGEVSSSEGI